MIVLVGLFALLAAGCVDREAKRPFSPPPPAIAARTPTPVGPSRPAPAPQQAVTPAFPLASVGDLAILAQGVVSVPSQGAKWQICRVTVTPGPPADEHVDQNAAISYVLEGTSEDLLDGRKLALTSGQAVFYPVGGKHTPLQSSRALLEEFILVSGDVTSPFSGAQVQCPYLSDRPVPGLRAGAVYMFRLGQLSLPPWSQWQAPGHPTLLRVVKGRAQTGQAPLAEGAVLELDGAGPHSVANPSGTAATVLVAHLVPGEVYLLEDVKVYEGPFPSPASVRFATQEGTAKEVQAFPGQVQVLVQPGTSADRAKKAIEAAGGTLLGQIPSVGYYLTAVPPGREAEAIAGLHRDAAVLEALPHLALDVDQTPAEARLHEPVVVRRRGVSSIILDCFLPGVRHGEVTAQADRDAGGTVGGLRNVGVYKENSNTECYVRGHLAELGLVAAVAGAAQYNPETTTIINMSFSGGNPDTWEQNLKIELGLLRNIPKPLRENVLITQSMGNFCWNLSDALGGIRLRRDGELAAILREHVLLVGASDATATRQCPRGYSNYASAGDPDVVYVPGTVTDRFGSTRRGTSFSAPTAEAILEQVLRAVPGLSGRQALQAAKAAARNNRGVLERDRAIPEARRLVTASVRFLSAEPIRCLPGRGTMLACAGAVTVDLGDLALPAGTSVDAVTLGDRLSGSATTRYFRQREVFIPVRGEFASCPSAQTGVDVSWGRPPTAVHNLRGLRIPVSCPPPPPRLPNLTLGSDGTGPGPVYVLRPTTIDPRGCRPWVVRWTILNRSDVAVARSFLVNVTVSGNQFATTVSGLAAGARHTGETRVNPASQGRYPVRVVIDALRDIAESDEGDNVYDTTFEMWPVCPEDTPRTPSPPQPGGTGFDGTYDATVTTRTPIGVTTGRSPFTVRSGRVSIGNFQGTVDSAGRFRGSFMPAPGADPILVSGTFSRTGRFTLRGSTRNTSVTIVAQKVR